MRKIVLVGFALLSLTACGSLGENDASETATDGREVDLPDGSTVMCVVSDGVRSGGVTCDWDGLSNP